MKIIFVGTCADCPYFRVRGLSASEKYYCGKNFTSVTDIGSTPIWCPLPDASQPGVEGQAKICRCGIPSYPMGSCVNCGGEVPI